MQHDDDGEANANEGADPSEDVKAQNPGETTTADAGEPPVDTAKPIEPRPRH